MSRPNVAALSLVLAATACGEDPADPPQYGLFSTVVVLAEVEGRFTPDDPGPSRVALLRPFVAGPALTPDFIDFPAPPFCMGFTFAADRPPNVVSGDAGSLELGGLRRIAYRDLTQGPTPGARMTAPEAVACRLASVGETSPYACDLPSNALIDDEGAWWDDAAELTMSVAGGAEVGPFDVGALQASLTATTAGGFALDRVDPRAPVNVQWKAPGADFVMIELLGQRVDGSAGAQILCLATASDGAKAIPEAALELLPAPRAQAPVALQTSLVALSAARGYVGWGNYLFAAGRGAFGVSVLAAP